MNIFRSIAASICVLAALLFLSTPAESRVYVDITQPFAKLIPVAVPDFAPIVESAAGPAGLGQKLSGRLGDNLDMTGIFIVLDKRTFLEADPRAGLTPGSAINFKEWIAVGDELLVKGAFSLAGDELTLEMRLFDVFEGRMLLGKRYTGAQADANQMINRFCNDIMFLLTGEQGIFGSRIAFVAPGSGGVKQIFMAEFGGDSVVQVTRSSSDATLPVISLSGTEIAYVTRRGRAHQLRSITLGGEDRQISRGDNLHLTPAFTPNGGVMCAISGKNDTNLYLLDPSGRSPVPVTRDWGINISPTLSPNGSQMAFVSNRAGGAQIYVSPASGGPARRLTFEGKENTDPHWSPRGDRIVFVGATNGGGRDIFTIDPNGGDLQQLTANAGRNTRPSWSPDGRMIVFSSNRNGRDQLFTMTANGERQRALLPELAGAQTSPFWSPVRPDFARKTGQ